MKRRSFIRNTGLGVIGTAYVPVFLSATNKLNPTVTGKKLIIIQLSGGNDGLNTIIPYEDDLYHIARPKIRIPKNEVIQATDLLGFNPALKEISQLYNVGSLSIINSVGYPNPNRSHFRSMDIWHTASDANQYLSTGWIGRYLDAYCDHHHSALEIDSQLSLSMNGINKNGLALTNSSSLYRSIRGKYFDELIDETPQIDLDEDNLGYLYKVLADTDQSAAYIKQSHKVKDNNYEFPKSKLGKKLSLVSQFIRSGLDTEVYYVSHNGFDSHANQRKQQDRLLTEYSTSVYSLVQSLEKSGHMDDTLIMTFSEFGRRVNENASSGTDHGKANNLFIIGKDLKKPGFYNDAPDLTNLDDGDIRYQVDFRNVYSDVIQQWMGKDPSKVISRSFDNLGII